MGATLRFGRRGRGRGRRGSISRGDPSRRMVWMLRLFFLVFFAAGFAFLWFMFIVPVMGVVQARNWSAVPCTVLSSEVESHSDSDGTTYSIEIRYRYVFDDRTYESDRYGFMDASTSGRSGKQAVVDAHPPGAAATCYVNPDDPSEAVLHRGLTWDMAFAAIPLLFVAIGGAGLMYAPRLAGYRPKVADPEGKANYLPEKTLAAVATGGDAAGPVVLTSGGGRLKSALGVALFAIIWNGFCWPVMLLVVVPDEGLLSFPGAILSLFCVIGLGMVGLVGWNLLGLANPQVWIELASRTLRLGEPMTLNWQVLGNAHRLENFVLVLEGVEEATYQRGTNTVTDRETFATHELVRLDLPEARELAVGGDVERDLPADTMHSFEARRNKITWRLRASGSIPRWPDVNDTFDLMVLPRRV